jgi:hypothetical protein
MASHADGAPDAATALGAIAARETLIELLSVATHDLNNPLQSLIVLLELSVDDAAPGSEARARAEQCQIAAERIRALTAALAGLLRGRREDGPRIWDRAQALLGRRFERLGVTTRVDLSRLADIAMPSTFFFGLCAACLVVLATAAGGALRGHELAIEGSSQTADGTGTVSMDLSIAPVDASAAPSPSEWDPIALQRLVAIVGESPEMRAVVARGRILLSATMESALT